ncbi:SDR family oxidoreductase [Xylophilus sp. GOD-11R]|uniref:SDR family oxidoreductase n=1 Tax=Xylophilus sp. GOD-11R TaxID=3089814 RepID=UPI00298C57C6|nr:SDR family oxidoreductase [Xylophilus sp. GOD-11R]WPB58847.1 SDR family oxidoreductase [Xylophilus sp. GOD-11R]
MSTTQKIALVTGATRGIGFETVRQLAQSGALVLLAGRKPDSAVEAADRLKAEGLSVEPITLDVTDSGQIAAAAALIQQRFGCLDILVNNAGVLVDDLQRKPSAQSLDTWRKTFDTNVFAVVEVTQALLPLLKAAPAGRIVNVSSQLGSLGWHTDPSSPIYDFKIPAYNASKTAVNAWTIHLAYELKDTPLKVNAIHPGYVQTEMNGGNGEIGVSEGARSSVGMALLDANGPSGSFTHLGKTLPW